jgi:hypothetical protein
MYPNTLLPSSVWRLSETSENRNGFMSFSISIQSLENTTFILNCLTVFIASSLRIQLEFGKMNIMLFGTLEIFRDVFPPKNP